MRSPHLPVFSLTLSSSPLLLFSSAPLLLLSPLPLRAPNELAKILSKMSIEKFIDDQIRKAIDAGEFDNLPGKGTPIDLTAYFETPEDLRMAYSILRSNNFVPEEVEMLKEIEELKKRLVSSSGETHQRLKKDIASKTYAFNMLIEKRKRR